MLVVLSGVLVAMVLAPRGSVAQDADGRKPAGERPAGAGQGGGEQVILNEVQAKLRAEQTARLRERLNALQAQQGRFSRRDYDGTRAAETRVRIEARRRELLLEQAREIFQRLTSRPAEFDLNVARLEAKFREIEAAGQRLARLQGQDTERRASSAARERRRAMHSVIHAGRR
jgi:hypothetical protein